MARPCPADRRRGLPEPYAQWARDGKLLRFPFRDRQALWPVVQRPHAPRWGPVPGIEPLVAAAAKLRPEQISNYIEAVLIDWSHEFEDEPTVRIALELPVGQARQFGFLTAKEQHASMAKPARRPCGPWKRSSTPSGTTTRTT
ncbi:hypothetical protein [Streptomyces chryseus]